ncbi:glucosaminidase domain-containing protein [Polluticoccus soli]|uniref:glucosaminidase domain-containing protein n=1 Tax=Polluticoccus soli TaxID=3034150 RepID=UPI0023E1F37F|nr:glucosaminidase domain-containing protein [Flavipsychrobacter sp. JY13-12]
MLKIRIVSIASMLLLSTGIYAQGDYATRAKVYVEQFRDLAIAEQKRSGVPAAITLAQGIHETSAGSSELATNANNHFGIKCKKSWQGEKYTYTDDAPNECFRKYGSPIESYKDHSDYLASQPRYASLFKLSPTDYFSWAVGLKQAGYATNPRYAQVLIKLIEDFKLQEYTYAALDNRLQEKVVAEVVPTEDAVPQREAKPVHNKEDVWAKQSGNIKIAELAPEPTAVVVEQPESFPPYGQLVKVNGLRAVYAKKGDMPLEYAITHNIRYERILEINEIPDKPLQGDMYLYLERKRFKGLKPAHTVKAGETLAKIAQYEGIQQKYLRTFNHLLDGEEPAEGEALHLQDYAIAKPKLRGAVVAKAVVPQTPAKVEEVVERTPESPEVVAEVDNAIPTTHSKVERVAQPQPEPQYVATGNTPTGKPDVQYAAVKEAVVVEQPKEMGPVPTQEVAKPSEPVVAAEPAGAMPPAPGDAPDEDREEEPATVNPPINIANEKAVEEEIAQTKTKKQQQEEEPQDELAALKAKFDKVVYAPKSTPAAEPQTESKVEEPTSSSPVKEDAQPIANGARFYVVKKGDTAFGIAKRNNITVKELMDWNTLSFEGIKVGQKLRVKP